MLHDNYLFVLFPIFPTVYTFLLLSSRTPRCCVFRTPSLLLMVTYISDSFDRSPSPFPYYPESQSFQSTPPCPLNQLPGCYDTTYVYAINFTPFAF